MSLTSTDILLFDTLSNCVLKYLKVSLSTVVIVSSQEDTEAPSETKKITVSNLHWFIHRKWGIFSLNMPPANIHLFFLTGDFLAHSYSEDDAIINFCESRMETLRSGLTDKTKQVFEIERKISSDEFYVKNSHFSKIEEGPSPVYKQKAIVRVLVCNHLVYL